MEIWDKAYLPNGCFLHEGRVSSNRSWEIDRNKCECENEKITNSPVSKGVGRYWIKINRPWICDSFEQNTLSIFHSLPACRSRKFGIGYFWDRPKVTGNTIWNKPSATPPLFCYELQTHPPLRRTYFYFILYPGLKPGATISPLLRSWILLTFKIITLFHSHDTSHWAVR